MSNLEERIIAVLRTVYDPEIPVNIYDLGLIYGVGASPEGVAELRMTLTSPMCPVAESLPSEVERRVAAVDGVSETHVTVVWDPPWSTDMMSEEAKIELGFY